MGKSYLIVSIFVFGCSASAGRPDCEKTNSCSTGGTTGGKHDLGGGGGGDLNAPPDLALPVNSDLSQGQKGFGAACGDKSECLSGICILTGIGGTCSQLCDNSPCPEGYGCYGVLGAIDPGQVANVCVSEHNELCTPCDTTSECSAVSNDICYAFPTGGSFCARDCSSVNCPTGYNCQDVTVGDAGMLKQCIPVSGACDCNSTLLGAKKNCSIPTPFGTCTAQRTCGGASGWGTCAPPSTIDVPDDSFTDDNCDGIDGDITKGIFVAVNQAGAADNATCGTYTLPCKSINYGINQAANAALNYVYIQAGVYNESVTMFNGISLVGGYDSNWQRATASTSGHTVTINGTFNSTEGQFVAVVAHTIAAATTTIWDLNIVAPSANDGLHPGMSSYGIHMLNAKLTLRRVGITASTGATGSNGAAGHNAHFGLGLPNGTVTATAGQNAPPPPSATSCPGPAGEDGSACSINVHGAGGAGGGNSCQAGRSPTGGAGGGGGNEDTSCESIPIVGTVCDNCNATAGSDGIGAAYEGGSPVHCSTDGCSGAGGAAGNDGSLTCTANSQPGNSGQNGTFTDGGKGSANTNRFGQLAANYWASFPGGNGGVGDNGGGGGGGGGSGGDDCGNDSYGAGGGGGGAGGCAAVSGGGGGGGGGGSFGIFAFGSTSTSSVLTIVGGSIALGTGGTGGAGGRGGTGQDGGSGAAGGNGPNATAGDGKNGGQGGNGGHGGHSGGGAGGNGGNAYGIYTTTTTLSQSASISGGNAGSPGSAGLPALNSAGTGAAGGAAAGDPGNTGLTSPVCSYPSPGAC